VLKKIISGGQTGADVAGLKAAKYMRIKTGGWMPYGCKTQDGPRRDYLEKYGMKECMSYGYAARTDANVRSSDATIRFANNFYSPGELSTIKAINRHDKPYMDVHFPNGETPQDVAAWLLGKEVEVLNVAGNSESTAPGIGKYVYGFLIAVLASYREMVNDGKSKNHPPKRSPVRRRAARR
jgi:hypothetical protein